MEQKNKQQWVTVEAKNGDTVGITLDRLREASEAREENLPKTRSEEQKKRVVSKLMSRLWGETS